LGKSHRGEKKILLADHFRIVVDSNNINKEIESMIVIEEVIEEETKEVVVEIIKEEAVIIEAEEEVLVRIIRWNK
jgi:hypothetical protein